MEEERKQIPWHNVIPLSMGILLGLGLSYGMERELLLPAQVARGVVVLVLSQVISVFIHELGHLICGIATGYHFISFRVGNWLICRITEYEEVEPPEPTLEEQLEQASTPEERETILAHIADVEEIPSLGDTAESGFELLSEESKAAIRATKDASGVPEGEEIPLETVENIQDIGEVDLEDEDEQYEETVIHRRYAIKRYKMPGTLGQCILCPPNYKNPHRVPYQAYLYGGGIANLVSIPFACIALLLAPSLWWAVAIFAFIATMTAVSNLVPMKLGGLPNDGYTVKLCKEDPHSHAAFVYQMRIVAALNDGISVGDMPEEWFYAKFPLSERMTTNILIANLWSFTGDRFLIHGELFQAKIIYEALANARGLFPLLRQEGVYRFLFTMISEGRVEQAKIYPIPKEMRKSAKKLEKYFPTYSCFRYAYGKLVSESGKTVKDANATFEKLAKFYPLEGAIQDSRVLLDRLEDVIIMR